MNANDATVTTQDGERLLRGLRWPLTIAVAVWLLKVAILFSFSIADLGATSWLIDDSFIMARIARNLATGCGYSFDCMQMTSGAPLTWTLLSAPYHTLFDAVTAMRVTAAASALVGGLCTLIVFVLARQLYGVRVAWSAFVLATFSLSLFVTPMNGMETALFALIGLLAVTRYALHFTGHKVAPLREYLLVGVLLGLLNLTRGDGVFVSLTVGIVELLQLLDNPVQRRTRLVRLSALVAVTSGITALLVMWALIADGVLLPANQSGRRFIALQSVMDEDYNLIPNLYARRLIRNFFTLSQLIAATVGTGILAVLALLWPIQRTDRVLRLVVALYVVLLLAFLALYQHYFPGVHGLRYMVFSGFLFSIFLARAADHLVTRTGRIRQKNGAVAVLIAGLLVLGVRNYQIADGGLSLTPRNGDTVWRTHLNDWVNATLPDGARIAAKDHGQLAYFTEAIVIDLAGIIQPQLVDELKAGRLPEFLAENEVEYILLNDKSNHRVFREAYAVLSLDDPVWTYQEPGASDTWEVYRLTP